MNFDFLITLALLFFTMSAAHLADKYLLAHFLAHGEDREQWMAKPLAYTIGCSIIQIVAGLHWGWTNPHTTELLIFFVTGGTATLFWRAVAAALENPQLKREREQRQEADKIRR